MDPSYTHLVVAGGAASVAIAATLWALRVTDAARGSDRRLRDRIDELEDRLQRADSIFASHPGLVLIWEEAAAPEAESGESRDIDWGRPRLYGSPLALASLLRFGDAAVAEDTGVRILQGLAAYQGRDATGQPGFLAPALAALRREGRPFTLTISNSEGLFVEIDGRTAGSRAAVWITDSSVKGVEESAANGRLQEARQVIARDPTAFLEMFSRAPFLAWRVSAAGRLEWANAAYVAALDAKTLDQAIARNVLLDPLTADQARRAIETGGEVEDTRQAVLNGALRTLKVLSFPVAGGVAGIATDVTDAQAAREALNRTVRAHDETLDALAEGIAIFDADRRLVFFNRAFANLWGLDPGFLASRPTHGAWLDALKERRKLPAHANYAEWRAGELIAYQDLAGLTETLWQLPGGRTLRIARQAHPLGGLLFIFSDITNETTLKSQYAALLQTQRAAMDKLHEAVVVFGLDGRSRLSNAAFQAMWRLRPEDVAQPFDFDRMIELCEPLHHDRATWAAIKGRVTDPSPQARQESSGEMTRSDGAVLTYLTRPLPDGATLIAFVDVTATKKVEQALRDRAEAFEAADRLKTEFVQNVSYQLRTPLQTINGYAEVLAKFMAGPLNDRQRDQLAMILQASDSLSKLVDNILDVAMIEAGSIELEIATVDVADLLQEVAALVESQAAAAGVVIKVAHGEAVGAFKADPKRIKQILMNLLSNALRFTTPGDEVTLSAERAGGMLTLSVSDTGQGIPHDAQAAAFDPFISGDRRGAGLGLALVRSFTELHNGWVSLTSEPGKGATVACHFPAPAAAAASPTPGGAATIAALARG